MCGGGWWGAPGSVGGDGVGGGGVLRLLGGILGHHVVIWGRGLVGPRSWAWVVPTGCVGSVRVACGYGLEKAP